LVTILSVILIVPDSSFLSVLEAQQITQQPAQPAQQQTQQPAQQNVKISPDQLDSLVAPIALYPDPLLSQVLVASTYPLEIMQLQQWLGRNQNLKDQALKDAVSKQPWDPSIQAMAGLPEVVKFLADDIQWTTDLGNAFLAQQGDVMDAVQRMRKKAEAKGTLQTNDKIQVQNETVGGKSVVVIEQAQPEVVYVPSYNPTAVYGAPAYYPYPSIAYPAYYPGSYLAASAISFGAGVAMGAFWSGGWGWGAGWGGNDIDMNFNNSFNRNASANRNVNRTGGNRWQHNPQHRGGAPYANSATANRFGSNTRGDSLASRQKGAQQQLARQKGNVGSSARAGNLGGGGARAGAGTLGAGGGAARAGTAARAGGARTTNFSGGANSIGGRNLGSSSSLGNRSGFSGGSRGFSGSSARASSSRGSSSFSRGGGGRRSGGGGGRSRGGGGGRGGRGGGRR
jgi:hypothetical protein